MTHFERLLLNLDEPPIGALWRIAAGAALLPAWKLAGGEGASAWTFLAFFLVYLFALRATPAVMRKLARFSPAVLKIWQERRWIAKRYVSYQWQKLLWIGVGIALFAAWDRTFTTVVLVLVLFSVAGGLLGLIKWRVTSAGLRAAQAAQAR